MPYLVIEKDCSNRIYTDDEPEITMLEFETKEDAEYYLLHGKKKSTSLQVFTDGACSGNGSALAKAGIGVYFGENDDRNVSKRIHGKQTNNTAELSAVIEVFSILEKEIQQGETIIIYTDSEYVIKCCTSYGVKCETQHWKKKKGEIPNVTLVKEVYSLYKQYENVTIQWIRAHTGNCDELSIGNEGADRLANMSIGKDQ
uniref:RNase H type-1 domain-containing protein n=1 Tax=viral metagenome TaxID=1070528 RepID=A0A6C0L3E6_9ZZZZ|tara:strand:+ start:118 stop:717 length:600 start_codon:yes stop_codon:yes gene_type:complete